MQERIERSDAAQRELGELTGARAPEAVDAAAADGTLEDYGPAPEFRGLVGLAQLASR